MSLDKLLTKLPAVLCHFQLVVPSNPSLVHKHLIMWIYHNCSINNQVEHHEYKQNELQRARDKSSMQGMLLTGYNLWKIRSPCYFEQVCHYISGSFRLKEYQQGEIWYENMILCYLHEMNSDQWGLELSGKAKLNQERFKEKIKIDGEILVLLTSGSSLILMMSWAGSLCLCLTCCSNLSHFLPSAENRVF